MTDAPTPHRSGRAASTPVPLLLAAVAALLSLLAACGGSSPQQSSESKAPAYSFVVPAGTYDAILRQEKVTIMPDELRLKVGDVVTIRNEDRYDTSVGPYFVKAGGTLELRYGTPGVFEADCTISGSGKLVVVVEQ